MVFHGLSIPSMYFACISQVRCAPKNPEHVSHMSESVGSGCTATCFQINEINSWRSCPITVTIMVLIARPWHCENEIQLINCKKFASPFKSYRFILIRSSLRTVTLRHINIWQTEPFKKKQSSLTTAQELLTARSIAAPSKQKYTWAQQLHRVESIVQKFFK